MSHYPNAVTPSNTVKHARKKRSKEVILAAVLGITVRLAIVGFELLGVYLFGSASLLLDALSSLFDAGSSVLFVCCLWYASKPPDENHPFGHGRFEPLVGMQLGVLLVALGGYMGFQQLMLATSDVQTTINPAASLFPIAAVVLLEISYRIIMRSAKKHDSPALAADAIHYRIDSLTSLVAAIALIFGAFFQGLSHTVDHIGAIAIAVVMVVIGAKAAWNNLHQLLDRVPAKEYFELVRESAKKVPGVLGTEKIRIQQYGPDAHVDIDIEVAPESSVDTAHKISQQVRAEIQQGWPAVRDVTVHIEPYYPNDH